jgi:hypothetical protein
MERTICSNDIRSHSYPIPDAPSVAPPRRGERDTLCVLDTLIESLKSFDKDLIRLARYLSSKSSTVKVCGRSNIHVPRESVYDTELIRILSSWLRERYGWTVTGQWHLRTQLGKNRCTDIILQKDQGSPIILEVLATGDASFVKSHIEDP